MGNGITPEKKTTDSGAGKVGIKDASEDQQEHFCFLFCFCQTH